MGGARSEPHHTIRTVVEPGVRGARSEPHHFIRSVVEPGVGGLNYSGWAARLRPWVVGFFSLILM